MKQGLQLRLSQQLAMTPQLQQAIRLLQLSTLELQQELQQALESNPLLEQTDLHEEVETQQAQDTETLDTVDALEQKEMPDELPLDASWDEIYTAGTPSGTRVDYQDDELPEVLARPDPERAEGRGCHWGVDRPGLQPANLGAAEHLQQ
jgi:RNA polymerase sigma-54 factor